MKCNQHLLLEFLDDFLLQKNKKATKLFRNSSSNSLVRSVFVLESNQRVSNIQLALYIYVCVSIIVPLDIKISLHPKKTRKKFHFDIKSCSIADSAIQKCDYTHC